MRDVEVLRSVVNRLTSECLELASPAGTRMPIRVMRLLCLLDRCSPAMFRPPRITALLGRYLVGMAIPRPLLKALTLTLRFNVV